MYWLWHARLDAHHASSSASSSLPTKLSMVPKYQVHIGFSLVPLRWVRFRSYWFHSFHFMVTIVLTSTYVVRTLHCTLIGGNFVFLPCVSCYCCTSISTCLSLFCVSYSCYFLSSSLSFSIGYVVLSVLQAWWWNARLWGRSCVQTGSCFTFSATISKVVVRLSSFRILCWLLCMYMSYLSSTSSTGQDFV